MERTHKTRNGYITLLGLIVIGSAALGIVTSLLGFGLAATRTAVNAQESAQARFLADACIEEALEQVRTDTSFLGSGTLSAGGGTCTYTIAASGGREGRTITATGTRGTMVRRTRVIVTGINPRLVIGSWAEGGSF